MVCLGAAGMTCGLDDLCHSETVLLRNDRKMAITK